MPTDRLRTARSALCATKVADLGLRYLRWPCPLDIGGGTAHERFVKIADLVGHALHVHVGTHTRLAVMLTTVVRLRAVPVVTMPVRALTLAVVVESTELE